ncbi:glutathionylspermidine synthase family protein [Dictyobacter alpinus]|uniref:glutathionylspermidine synthase family protein n=1 Tax=Dictyobacter alpinus TaxID=2014873 RepID=UPI0013868460|nr:glutathionylspermidine synthase family protein [Dictyobacter alpinus]
MNITPGSEGNHFAQAYREWRRAYYNRFPTFWGTLPGESVEEYAVYGALEISHEHAEALRNASSRLYTLMTRLALLLQQADNESLIEMGIPVSALPYVHIVMPEMPAVMCGRFEFVMSAEGPKLLEFNAETPTFVVELFHMNGQVCTDFGLPDPNVHCQQQLVQAVRAAITAGLDWIEPQPSGERSVVFSAYAHRKEERITTEFYHQLLLEQGDVPYRTSFRGLHELRVTRNGLFTADGERVDVLYKLYPTEHLMLDEDVDGTPVGLALMELVRKRQLAVINPPISFVLQNKALVAILWALHLAESELFTSEEHAWIEQYVLPTYLSPLDAEGQPIFTGQHVIKPVYGREGSSVTILDQHEVIEHSQWNFYDKQIKVYQQYAGLPTTTIQTEAGLTPVNLVHNCFIVDGTPSAIGVRACQKLIFDDNSYFLPVCSPTTT